MVRYVVTLLLYPTPAFWIALLIDHARDDANMICSAASPTTPPLMLTLPPPPLTHDMCTPRLARRMRHPFSRFRLVLALRTIFLFRVTNGGASSLTFLDHLGVLLLRGLHTVDVVNLGLVRVRMRVVLVEGAAEGRGGVIMSVLKILLRSS